MNHSADQLRGFIDSMPTLAWSAASDGVCRVLQSTLAGLHGPLGIAGLGWGWKAAIHPEDLPRLLDAFHRARESGQPFEFEGRLRRFDGESRRFLIRGDPVRDERECVVRRQVSGRLQADNISELSALLNAEPTDRHLVLDLKDVVLVELDIVRFLRACEGDGIELRNCPPYIPAWIAQEAEQA